jgi:protein phosphatase
VSIGPKDRENSKLRIKDLQNSKLQINDLQATRSFGWTSASRSHPGRVREVNEDACLDQPEHELWAVADGMGGHTMGEFASGLAVQRVMSLPVAEDLAQRVKAARNRLQEANRDLRAEALRREIPLIGTTIAALLAAGRRCACLWAGDSRIYLYRAGHVRQLTRDHSHLEAARSRHVGDLGDTVIRPRANLVTRALGCEDMVKLDEVTIELFDDDIFLLCSDGLSNELSEPSIEQALMPGICTMACDTLVDMALERDARDNISAVVVRAKDLRRPDRTELRAAP